jgi:hypothetical protein
LSLASSTIVLIASARVRQKASAALASFFTWLVRGTLTCHPGAG